MFDYPITLPPDTLYQELGIGPEATAEEIRGARSEYLHRLDLEIKADNDRLDAAHEAVEGLKELAGQVERLETGESGLEELAQARARLAELEREAEKTEPDYRQLKERIRKLKQQQTDVNRVALDNMGQQREYDESHPPLNLLKLQRDPRNAFANDNLDLERRLALIVLRRELYGFLAEQGETVFHPSDLTREDFSSDYTYHPLLDEPRA